MNSRTYYGEYSLKHWLQLLLSGNIVLPQYQRSFVWKEQDMKRLIKSLVEKQFVPPVTLALFNSKAQNITTNLIIDGQQRTTALTLITLALKKYGNDIHLSLLLFTNFFPNILIFSSGNFEFT